MQVDRKVLEQALEALESCSGVPHWPALQPTITALRAALEQPEQAEPVATVAMDVSRAHLSWDGKYLGQRPDMKIAMLLKDLPVGTLLFSTPPRREWRSLSEKEIGDVFHAARNAKLGAANDNSRHRLSVVEIARAVEAKLKERNT